VVRYYSKIWVNPQANHNLEGESCLSLWVDGTLHNVDDGLAFELKETFKSDNILSLNFRQRNPRLHSL